MTNTTLENEVIELIFNSINLPHKNKSEVEGNTPLIGDAGLGLDSLDILEIVVAVEKKYGIKIASADEGKTVFQTIGTLAEFVSKGKTP